MQTTAEKRAEKTEWQQEQPTQQATIVPSLDMLYQDIFSRSVLPKDFKMLLPKECLKTLIECLKTFRMCCLKNA